MCNVKFTIFLYKFCDREIVLFFNILFGGFFLKSFCLFIKVCLVLLLNMKDEKS